MTSRSMQLSLIVTFAAFAVVGRLALVGVPNVSLSFLVVFIAGVAYGPRVGAATGLLSRIASDLLLTGLNPIFVPMCLVEAALGLAAGLLGQLLNFGQRGPAPRFFTISLLVNLGLLYTIAFSVLADSITWLFYNFLLPDAPDAARGTLWLTLVVQGLLFSVPSIAINAVLFPTAVPPILANLRAAGLLPEPRAEPVPAPAAT